MFVCLLSLISFRGVLFVKELLPIVNWALADICGLSNETQSESDPSYKLTNYFHPHVTDCTCHYWVYILYIKLLMLIIMHGILYINCRNCMLLGYLLLLTLTGESGHWGLINSQWSMSVQSWSVVPSSPHQIHQPEACISVDGWWDASLLIAYTQSVRSFSLSINGYTQHSPSAASQHWNNQVKLLRPTEHSYSFSRNLSLL